MVAAMVMTITATALVLNELSFLLRRDGLPTGLDDRFCFGIDLATQCVLSIFGEMTVDGAIGGPESVEGGGGHGRRNIARIRVM
jgi:hypothetical protein